MYDEIIYDVDDPVATITLDRPEALNAWTNRMAAEVRDAVGRAERDRRVVGIVLTGAGRGFCAGADMKMLSGLSGGDRDDTAAPVPDDLGDAGDPVWGEDLRGEYTYLMSVPKPIIAAINGPIAGMAVPIALACDLRYMTPDAVLTVAFSQRGLIAEWGIAWLLPASSAPPPPSTCCSRPAGSTAPKPSGSGSSTASCRPTSSWTCHAPTSPSWPNAARLRRSRS